MGWNHPNPIYMYPRRKRRAQCSRCKYNSGNLCNQRRYSEYSYAELEGFTDRNCGHFEEGDKAPDVTINEENTLKQAKPINPFSETLKVLTILSFIAWPIILAILNLVAVFLVCLPFYFISEIHICKDGTFIGEKMPSLILLPWKYFWITLPVIIGISLLASFKKTRKIKVQNTTIKLNICQYCGTEIDLEDSFCPECGKKLKDIEDNVQMPPGFDSVNKRILQLALRELGLSTYNAENKNILKRLHLKLQMVPNSQFWDQFAHKCFVCLKDLNLDATKFSAGNFYFCAECNNAVKNKTKEILEKINRIQKEKVQEKEDKGLMFYKGQWWEPKELGLRKRFEDYWQDKEKHQYFKGDWMYCSSCHYEWKIKKERGLPARCIRCNSTNIKLNKVYSYPNKNKGHPESTNR